MNPLDIVMAAVFELVGIPTPYSGPQPPKLDGSERFDVKGQTKTQTKGGKTRNFKSAAQSANRAPSLDPIETNNRVRLNRPNYPPGGFGQSPGQLNLYGQTQTNALPPAGQTGGSQLPLRVTAPVDGRPKPKQGPLSRRQVAQNKLNQSAQGTRGTNVITPKAGAATAADARGTRLKNAVKGGAKTGGKTLSQVTGPLANILNAVMTFQGAKDEGATNLQAARTSGGSLAGGAAGFGMGSKIGSVVGPKGSFIMGLIGGLIGATGGEQIMKNIQGYGQDGEQPAPKPEPTEPVAEAPVVPQTPIQEPIPPTTPQQPVQPQQTAPQQTPPPPRVEAPVRLNRQQLTPQPTITGYGNLGGVQQVSPNRGDLRPNRLLAY